MPTHTLIAVAPLQLEVSAALRYRWYYGLSSPEKAIMYSKGRKASKSYDKTMASIRDAT